MPTRALYDHFRSVEKRKRRRVMPGATIPPNRIPQIGSSATSLSLFSCAFLLLQPVSSPATVNAKLLPKIPALRVHRHHPKQHVVYPAYSESPRQLVLIVAMPSRPRLARTLWEASVTLCPVHQGQRERRVDQRPDKLDW